MTENKTKGGGEQNLTVALRIRPMNEDEISMGATQIAYKVQKKMCVLMDPMEDPEDVLRANRSREKQFVFDCTFDGGASQEEVYRTTSQFLIPSVISGYNATVFAYGATGAGKTYTMLGAHDEPGIMAQALNDLFLEMERTSEDMSYRVTMSYLEIYNEMIRDLLNPSAGILDLREDAKGGVQVAGLSEVMARSTDEVIDMLLKGNKERTQEPTAANKTSSRSHAVLQVSVKQQNKVRSTTQEVRVGRLFMIDLAGSERAANTHNRGKRMVEGAHINRSLLALGNCINALTDTKGSKYVNYRDSKLTRLLKEALGGNCKTVMIAHISPASIHFEESRNTLVYADRAKHIKTKVRRNVTDVSYHIAQYTNIIQELREEIQRLRHRLHDKSTGSPRPGVNIQAVQAEVVEAKREELNKLKEQLLISFKDQMELRKSLMELNNASMEVSLETNRNQLIISEWELDKARFSRRKEGGDKADTEDSKALELAGAGSDELQESDDVRLAREELKVLHEEKHRTEKLRATVMKELEQARVKTRRIEETVPQRINTEDQREILNLLCKVHELEIENTETQSACLLREFQIKRKDMVISRFRQHQNLCDQIIKRQKQIMEENKIAASQDLEELYNLYKLERDDRMMLREDSGHLSPELRLKASSNSSNYRNLPEEVDQLSTLTEEDERGNLLSYRSGDGDDKLFSKSARGFKGSHNLSGAWRNDSNLSNGANGRLSDLHGAHASLDDRKEIASNTRSIAALAAKKRSKAHNDLLNLERQFGGEPRTLYRNSGDRSNSDNDYLSPSTLARHDRNYGELVLPPLSKPPSEDNLDNISTGTKQSTNTDSTLPPLRNESNFRRGGDIRRNRRTRGYDVSQNRRSQSHGDNGKSGESRDWTPPSVNKRGGKTKRYSNRGSNEYNGNSNSRKKVPTIPSYRKGDITVMGFSLPR
ncbi:kinesin-like protein KIF19 isoform X2 [Crassostrea virginica]